MVFVTDLELETVDDFESADKPLMPDAPLMEAPELCRLMPLTMLSKSSSSRSATVWENTE